MLYRPDNVIGAHARLRLRAGPGAFAICGVTHTISTPAAMTGLADIVAAPVMPWDALICTSAAARSAVETVLDAETEVIETYEKGSMTFTVCETRYTDAETGELVATARNNFINRQ